MSIVPSDIADKIRALNEYYLDRTKNGEIMPLTRPEEQRQVYADSEEDAKSIAEAEIREKIDSLRLLRTVEEERRQQTDIRESLEYAINNEVTIDTSHGATELTLPAAPSQGDTVRVEYSGDGYSIGPINYVGFEFIEDTPWQQDAQEEHLDAQDRNIWHIDMEIDPMGEEDTSPEDYEDEMMQDDNNNEDCYLDRIGLKKDGGGDGG